MLFHLGVVRFLRDAGLMSRISDVCAVSGGSILAAHIGLHWNQYSGDDSEFDSVAQEIIRFARRDIRGKILRRLPLCWLSQLVPGIRLDRSKLLQWYYAAYLFGQARVESLSQSGPTIHLLATNLTTGASCSISHKGLSIDDPNARRLILASHMPLSLAVACSSAFPGFFPPIPITAKTLGTRSQFWLPSPQILTDGGVYDNLGIRKVEQIKAESHNQDGVAPASRHTQSAQHTSLPEG